MKILLACTVMFFAGYGYRLYHLEHRATCGASSAAMKRVNGKSVTVQAPTRTGC